jgi:hypothetical protein
LAVIKKINSILGTEIEDYIGCRVRKVFIWKDIEIWATGKIH